MFEVWQQELVRKHFDGKSEREDNIPVTSVEYFNPCAAHTDINRVRQGVEDKEDKTLLLHEDGWESGGVLSKVRGLNVCSIILICSRDFFYQEPLWGKRGGGGAMWKGVWDWLLARARLRALKWWGHSSVGNQVNLC